MPRIVDIEGVGLVEVDDRIGENQLLEFSQTLRQGALPAAGNALMQQGGRMVGGGMMGLTRVGLEEPPPIMSAAQVESPAGMAAYERRRAAWEKRVKEVPPEVYQARAAELEASPTFQMGKALQQGAEEAFPVNPLRQDDYLTQIASGIGSLPVSVVPGVGQLAYGFSAGEDAAQKTGKVYDARIAQALAEGDAAEVNRLQAEKPVKQYQSALYTAPIGALTEFGIGAVPAFGRAVAGQVNKSIFKEAARTAVEEGAQEVSEQWLGNAVAKKTYNPDQKLTEGLYESGAAGSGVGALVGLIGGKAGRVASNQRLAQELNAPLSEAQIQEIINRQAAGRAAIGGDPSNPLPNATATLAGINAGGAPSGPIRITPPEEGFTIPEMQLETEAGPEEVTPTLTTAPVPVVETPTTTENAIQEQGAGEGLLRAEEPQPEVQVGLSEVDQGGRPAEGAGTEAQAEVQPLTIKETNEYNTIIDFLDGRSAYETLEDDQWNRFDDLSVRVRELEDAGFEFDEATGWTKPGVAPTPAAAAPVAPTLLPEEAAQVSPEQQEMERLRKIFSGPPRPLSAPEPVAPTPVAVAPEPATQVRPPAPVFRAPKLSVQDRALIEESKSDPSKEGAAKLALDNWRRRVQVAEAKHNAKMVSYLQGFDAEIAAKQAEVDAIKAEVEATLALKPTPAAVTVTQTPVKPAAPKAPKSKKAREWASKGDILDDIISLGGVMSKSQAKKEKRLEKIKDLYDDAPRLDPYFNKIFGGRSRGTASRNQPDQLLAELATENPGKYGDMSVSEFWAEVDKAARGRKGDVVAMKQEAKATAAGAEEAMGLDAFLQAQDDAFVDAQSEGMQNAGEPDGPIQISVGSLALGDKFSVQGEQFEVTVVTPDGGYTIRDGDKFGVQQLTENDTLFVDETPDRGPGDAFEFPTEGPAPAERKPRLAAGQNQGDLISSTQVEDFALVGEKGVDLEARKQKAQAAARAAAEAKAAQEKAQTNLFGESPTQQAGKAALDAIDQITKSINENQYSDPLLLTPLAKLALQIAKGLIRTGMAVDRAIRQAVAQARESYPNETASDKSLTSAMLQAADINNAVGQIAPNDGEQAQGFVEPKKTVRAYKLFRTLKTKPGKLFPLFIGKNESVPVGEWISAKFIPTQGFAERPGWHAGILPNAPHLLRKDGTMPSDRVWAEVEIPADVDWQSRADSTATGDIQSEVPAGGNYKFKRPGLQGGSWIIGGALKVNRVLSQLEVDKIMRDSGASKAAPVGEMSDAVAEASDAIAQFVESITPKAGITEGPTPEESARRVLKAFTDLAAVAIRSGIQTASDWAAGMQLKLSPALQYAWDQAQGITSEPTPEILADVNNLPKDATSSDFGMIYSTAEEPVTTKRGGFEDTVAGRRALTPEVRDAGIQLAIETFNEAGLKVREVANGLFAPVEGVNQEDAGRRMISIVKDKFAKAKAAGRGDTLYALTNSLRNHFAIADGFSQETRDELYLIGQSEASEAGRQLASLNVSVKDFVAVARNVRGALTSAIYDAFSGEQVVGILGKIISNLRGQFNQGEIDKVVAENPQLQPVIDQLGVMALADTGGRVYRAVQGRLKVKPPAAKDSKAAKRAALEDEAIEQIIENALALGVNEAPKVPSQKLTPDQRLALMTTPSTQAKVQKATEDAVKEAEFNAGWKAMMVEAAGDQALLQQYREAKAAGEAPTPESIENGLDLPEYAHWRTIRDGFLNYSPTTLKLAQDVIRGRFKGTQFGEKKVAPPAPPKIDLTRLVQQPNAEMSRVIGEQLTAVGEVMDLAGASPEAKARVMQMVTANVGSQIQLARQRVLNSFLDVKAKSEPTTASDRLRKLINAGITEDPRYRSQATRDLLKRVAKTYLSGDEFLQMATRPRAEKLAFLTGKLTEITTAENLTDEWMQGAVWTHLTERMMEAENSIVSQIVGANDVKFDPAVPKTEAQVAADRAKAVDRLAGGIRAGLLDQRIAESVAKNPALQRLVPKMSDLVKRVLETPQGTQAQLAKAFSQALLSELAIDQALADKTGIALAKAFQVKFERARITALSQAVAKLTPKELKEAGPGTPLWKKIEQFVNAGGMDSSTLLQSIAKKAGWKVPTDAEVTRLRDLARLEQELSTTNEEERKRGLTNDEKAAMNLGKRADIMREIQRRWASMTMPIRGNKENRARAINEVVSAELLFKPSFVVKQLIDTFTQMFYYTPTRAISAAVGRYNVDKSLNRQTRLWKDVGTALEDSYKARFQALNMALTFALEASKGRAERDTIMGIQSGIRALDRINSKATEYAKNGDYARATVLRLAGIVQLSYRYASALDALQGTLAEQQEMGAWAESQFRLQGMDPKQARKAARAALGDAIAEYALAQSLVADDPNITSKERRAAAWNVVRARQYQRIKAAGLDVDNLKQVTQDIRSTIGWNVEETGGLGGQIGKGMKGANDWLAKAGIPNPVGRFSNAIAIGINRALTFAGGGFVPSAFEGSAWYKTPEDRTQRKIEAATGLGLSGALAALVLSGALRVFTKWPDDKEEADLWERDGHKPGTMELDLPGGKILRVSLNTGPIQIARPALAAVGELQYQVARRNRLNQKAQAAAKKKGLTFEPRELTAKDMAGAVLYGAYSAVAQGRTASGLIGSGTYRQAPDMGKVVAGAVSPLIPFGPLVRELTAMSGSQFNPKDQTFINLLAPTPWSGKVDRNFLGDPVGTPRAQERIMSILTGGSAIVGGNETDRAYQVLAKTGWTPATQQNNRFHQFGRVERQATPEELNRMQEVRAVELKTRISQLDPATATKRQLDRIEDIANAKSKKAVGIR